MRYYLISGETSGDQHAAEVIRAIRARDAKAEFRGMAGDHCHSEGMEILIHQREMAIMGFWEVLKQLAKIARVFRTLKKDLLAFNADKLILVDYPGFNLRMAKFAKLRNIEVHYYIAPKVWAWKEQRIKKIKKWVDQLYCIIPFEKAYFAKHGINALYVGNPSKAKVMAYNKSDKTAEKTIAILPGSRKQEIESNLRIMLQLKSSFKDFNFVVSQAPGFNKEYYLQIDSGLQLEPDMYKLLASADYALVTSGTATLETALFKVPQIVCYRTSTLTYHLAKRLVKINYISLVNLILDQMLIPELIQSDFNMRSMKEHLIRLQQPDEIKRMQQGYEQLWDVLGDLKPAEMLAEHLVNAEI